MLSKIELIAAVSGLLLVQKAAATPFPAGLPPNLFFCGVTKPEVINLADANQAVADGYKHVQDGTEIHHFQSTGPNRRGYPHSLDEFDIQNLFRAKNRNPADNGPFTTVEAGNWQTDPSWSQDARCILHEVDASTGDDVWGPNAYLYEYPVGDEFVTIDTAGGVNPGAQRVVFADDTVNPPVLCGLMTHDTPKQLQAAQANKYVICDSPAGPPPPTR